MQIGIFTQPFNNDGAPQSIGSILTQLLRSRTPVFNRIWFVSAFVDQKAILRLAPHIIASKEAGADIHLIVGVDLRSMTIETLRRINSLEIDSKVFNNRSPGHTFHPKLYLFEATGQRAELLVGSNNMTNGGLYSNYEATTQISFDLPQDDAIYQANQLLLGTYLNPTGQTVQSLTEELIQILIQRGEVVSEAEKRQAQRGAGRGQRGTGTGENNPPSPFGYEAIPSPPPLPEDAVRQLVGVATRTRQTLTEAFEITEFYMHLNRLQGTSIPGEARIPIAARRIDQDFWGWPDQYQIEIRDRGAKERQYRTWKPTWNIIDINDPLHAYLEEVRIYEYEDSADFRFYSARLVSMGANEFDIVRITRSDEEDAVFVCELARQGTPTHTQWERYCTASVRNSRRRFGFA